MGANVVTSSLMYQLYIDGQFGAGAAKQTMTSINPATGREFARFAAATAPDVDAAITSARRALTTPPWASMTASARGRLLLKLADLTEQNAQRIGEIETADSGKLLAETATQTRYVADYYRYYAGLADKIHGATLPIDKPDMQVYTRREPIGVVAAVVPWNAQMFLTATKLAPALAAGCCCVVKASEIAPCALLEFARLIHAAGFPPGVVSVITGGADDCAIPLTSHPDIDRIAFTGGAETARAVTRNSANNFALTTLELGGKSPIVVFEDADVSSAINGLIAGNFGASGQSCVAGSRAIVHRSLLPTVASEVARRAGQMIIGAPEDAATHIGPLCTAAQVERIEQTLAAARAQGAAVHCGGARPQLPAALAGGNYFAPTVVECADAQSETLKVEMFGPVMSLLPFDTEEEAIALANDSDYGLGAGVFTQNLARAHRVSARIRAGICWVNTYRAISPIAPFGGFNQSGYGREGGVEAMLDYTRTKTVWINTSEEPMQNPFIIR